ncbi:MAG: O-antigen ligase family protein, partial [Limisphaerales bacterium]
GFCASAFVVQSTLSRAGLVIFAAGAVGVLGLGLVDQITKRRLRIIAVLGVIAAVGLTFTMRTIINRFNDYYNSESNHSRVLLNRASKRMLRDYPLGIGWNNYGLMINHPYPYGNEIDAWFRSEYQTVNKKERKGISESHYWLLLAENGYEGFISYLIFIGVFFWWSLAGAWFFRKTFLGCFSFGIAAGCGVNYLQSFYERVLTQPRNLMLWLIVLAATSRIETWRQAAKKLTRSDRKARRSRSRISENKEALEINTMKLDERG